jgi:hypothetical protein
MKIKQLFLVLFFAGTVFSACKNKVSGEREDTGEQQNDIYKQNNIMATQMNDTVIRLDSMDCPIVTKEFETFDFETYNGRMDKSSSQFINKLPDGVVIWMTKTWCSTYYPDS